MQNDINPAESRAQNLIQLGVDFSSMSRVFKDGSKAKIRDRIHGAREQLSSIESREEFDEWHSIICNWGISNIQLAKGVRPASYGQIAKTLNVVLKVAVYYGHLPNCEKATQLSSWLHAAVDNKMMRMLKRSFPDAISTWPKSIQQVDSSEKYGAIQELVGRYIAEFHPNITPVQFDDIYWWKLNKS